MLKPDYPIRTARLVLREFTESDLDTLHAYHSLPEVARFLSWEARTREESARSLTYRIEHPTIEKEGDGVVFAVEHRGELVGEVNLRWLSAEHGSGEIGFIFDPRHHGHGYAGRLRWRCCGWRSNSWDCTASSAAPTPGTPRRGS